ncbi:hypothetical protein RRF57_000032 [Xylaria bambusicola]|uniref:Uncharacterized protein n=1 Tax=Xylaria bambusicola TaxID=326684 RepID=A0AAN7UEV5_9PEZI
MRRHIKLKNHLLQPQNPPDPVLEVVVDEAGAGALLTLLLVSVLDKANNPITPGADAPAVVDPGVSPGASPQAFRSVSSFCLYSSASCRATASAVLACTKSATSVS